MPDDADGWVPLVPGRRASWGTRPCDPVAGLVLQRDRETPQYVVFSGKSPNVDWIVTVYAKKGTPAAGAAALQLETAFVVREPEPEPPSAEPPRRVIELED